MQVFVMIFVDFQNVNVSFVPFRKAEFVCQPGEFCFHEHYWTHVCNNPTSRVECQSMISSGEFSNLCCSHNFHCPHKKSWAPLDPLQVLTVCGRPKENLHESQPLKVSPEFAVVSPGLGSEGTWAHGSDQSREPKFQVDSKFCATGTKVLLARIFLHLTVLLPSP